MMVADNALKLARRKVSLYSSIISKIKPVLKRHDFALTHLNAGWLCDEEGPP
jgi:hypothetical protein